MKDLISTFPRLILPRNLTAFVGVLAVWTGFSFIPFTGTETNSGPYAALEPLLVPPAAASCDYEICAGSGDCIPETLALNCEKCTNGGGSGCHDSLCD